MKIFFGEAFIDKEVLEDAGINNPIKLEYYKRINEEELTQIDKAKYGISIVKTEFADEKAKVEERGIKYLTNDEKRVDFMLKMFKENNVTPIGLDDVICDFSNKYYKKSCKIMKSELKYYRKN